MSDHPWFIILSSAGSFFIVFVGMYFYLAHRQEKKLLKFRLSSLSSGLSQEVKDSFSLFQKKRHGIVEQKLQDYLKRFKSENWLQLQLYRSGVSFSLTYLFLCAFAFLLVMTHLTSFIFLWGLTTRILFSIALMVFGGYFILSTLIDRRQKLIVKHMPGAIEMIIRSLKAGYPIEKTFVLVAKEQHPAVALEFRKISQQMDMGLSYETALRHAGERVHTADFYFLVNALIIQRQLGGGLSETLENILFLLHRRHEIRQKMIALSAEAKMTGLILGSVPVAIWIIIMIIKPEYMDFFLYDPKGDFQLKLVIGLLLLEALTIKWLINIKME